MKYDPFKHKRRSIRLLGYDYAQPGSYFVTICTYKLQHLLGEVIDGEMVLNENGRFVQNHWHQIPIHFNNVQLGAFVMMPNHIHGIIVITELIALPKRTLGQIVGWFKYQSTKSYNAYNQTERVTLWHRNFYEHIIRNEREYKAISQYIVKNPQNWQDDPDR